jgi:hypothetical protein
MINYQQKPGRSTEKVGGGMQKVSTSEQFGV